MHSASLIRFGAFELDLNTAEIRKNGRRVRLSPQPFEVLALLASHAGQLVTREAIRQQLWGADTLVDFEHGLNFCVRQIRHALGESAKKPRFVETLPRRGYRFIAQPEIVPNRSAATSPGALAAGTTDPAVQGSGLTASLIVLEFQNLSGDATSEWLATGITESLTSDLCSLRSVRVASRERARAVLRELGDVEPPAGNAAYLLLGRRMELDWIVTGSYQHAGGRLRITPQILNVKAGDNVPISKADGTWDELFELQDRLARKVIEALQLTARVEELERIAAPQTRLLEAYEQYSKGRRHLYQLGKGSLDEARGHFESALKLDPDYAMAHSGLGATYAMGFIQRASPADLRQARLHLERASELDPELAEPYPWLSYVNMREGKLADAVAAGQRGAQLLPDVVHAQYFLGLAYFATCESIPGNYQHAATHLREAARIDPRWPPTWFVLSSLSLLNGNYASAELFAQRLLQLGTQVGPARFGGAELLLGTLALRRGDAVAASRWFTESLTTHATSAHVYRDLFSAFSACGLGDCELRQGRPELALTHYRRAWQFVQEAPTMVAHGRAGARALSGLAAAYGAQGDAKRVEDVLPRALHWLQRSQGVEGSGPGAGIAELWYAMAVAEACSGRVKESLSTLELAVNAGWRDAAWLERDPQLRPLAGAKGFVDLVRRVRSSPTVAVAIAGSEPRLTSVRALRAARARS